MSTVSMNPEEARSGGEASAEAASLLKDLPADFEEIIETAKTATDAEPEVTGWDDFSSGHVEHMEDVKSHADGVASDIQTGAEEGGRADLEGAEEYDNVAPPEISPI